MASSIQGKKLEDKLMTSFIILLNQETMNSLFSLGYYDEKGAVKGFDYKRYNFRLKTSYKPLSWLTIRPMISGAMQNSEDRQYSISAMYSFM